MDRRIRGTGGQVHISGGYVRYGDRQRLAGFLASVLHDTHALSIDKALETGLDTLRLRLVPSGVVYKLADTDVVTLPAELGYLIERGWLIEVST